MRPTFFSTIRFIILSLLFLTITFSCTDEQVQIKKDRPHDPWVFRSVLDTMPRMITMALNKNMWASYKVSNGSLYKIWDGLVNFEGAVYNQQHGPQPTSMGDAYFVNRHQSPFKLYSAQGTPIDYTYQYQGHQFKEGRVFLNYSLTHNDQEVIISESPEFLTSQGGNPIFSRIFEVTGLTEGQKLDFHSNASSIVVKENISSSSNIEVIDTKTLKSNDNQHLDIDFTIRLSNGKNTLDVQCMNKAMILNPNSAMNEIENPDGNSGLALIAKSDCKTCHNKTRQTIGPSYLAIANKYENSEANKSLLVKKIKEGGTGVWGQQVMTPHPKVPLGDIELMVEYIFSLRTDSNTTESNLDSDITYQEAIDLDKKQLSRGLITKIFNLNYEWDGTLDKINFKAQPIMGGVINNFKNVAGSDFTQLEDNFALSSTGYLKVDKDDIYSFRLWSDDGSKLFVNDKMLINNDGYHGSDYKEGNVGLKKGYHKIKILFFQGGGGKFLSLNMKKSDEEAFYFVDDNNLVHSLDERESVADLSLPMATNRKIPGNRNPLIEVHPSFDLSQARPEDFTPMVGGLAFLSDGRMIVSAWEPSGAVYLVEGAQTGDPSQMKYKKIAEGLAEPLGVEVVDDKIYVMQKQEMTQLIDHNGDDVIDEYRTLCDDWIVSPNFHEFGFDLTHQDGYLYAALAIGILPGGASLDPQTPDRGKLIKVNIETGEREFVVSGLRTPNGVGIGYKNDLYIADNQGDWLPSCKILHVSDGAFFGSRAVDFKGTEGILEKPPVVWLPQDEIGNSPSTPMKIDVGPYKGQMIHGEVTHGGVKRVFVEEINGVYQGAVFRFIQGLEAGVNRMVWGPDQALYIGGIGNPGNWGQTGKKWYGLQRLAYNNKISHEILAARLKSNGIELEFTKPLSVGQGWNPNDYSVKQWYYKPTASYGGPKLNEQDLEVKSATVSQDRTKVFLEFEGIQKGHVIYVYLNNLFHSEDGQELLCPELWYTANELSNTKGTVITPPEGSLTDNTLTKAEKEAGWELLFDGKNLEKWRNFRKETIGSSWIIDDDAIHLNSVKKDDGGWQAADGGDIISDATYENFELQLEWKIAPCGNSGIMFNVVESDQYDYVWMTGPEMQVLDNVCHPDAAIQLHRAGDLYDMIECEFETVKPAGEWNHVRLVSNQGNVEFWLNGYKVVSFQMHSEEWNNMIAKSKFKEWSGFGQAKEGHISLQDHGDKVWYKNIKIRKL